MLRDEERIILFNLKRDNSCNRNCHFRPAYSEPDITMSNLNKVFQSSKLMIPTVHLKVGGKSHQLSLIRKTSTRRFATHRCDAGSSVVDWRSNICNLQMVLL